MVYEAIERDVATIAMHTNADRAIATRERFAAIMGCSCLGNCETILDPHCCAQDKGFGALLVPDWGHESDAWRHRRARGAQPSIAIRASGVTQNAKSIALPS